MSNDKLERLYQSLELEFKNHPTLIIAGASFGDEGKGKIIDAVMRFYDAVVRFSGGANAGHTVKTDDGITLVSHLIPCGLAQKKVCVMAPGEFFDARLFVEEREQARKILGDLPEIFIDPLSPLWTPYHALLENYLESLRGEAKIGTTGKGIAPLEALFKLRIAPVVGDLVLGQDLLVEKLSFLQKIFKPLFDQMSDVRIPQAQDAAEELLKYTYAVSGHLQDTSFWLSENLKAGKRVLFEGAQATGLDSRFGTYPYVSAGHSVAAGAAIGTGLPMKLFSGTMLVAKILPTRVGGGPFPSELWERQAALVFAKEHGELFSLGEVRDKFLKDMLDKINSGAATKPELSQYFQVLGQERGATTGRGRSVGLPDIPWLQYACRINAPQWLAITRFDMLSGLRKISVVVGYQLDGKLLPSGQIPPPWRLAEVKPIIEEWDAWPESIYALSSEAELPEPARKFLQEFEKRIGTKILLVGTGPERDALIVRR